MKKQIERRAYDSAIELRDDSREIVGHAAVFEQLSDNLGGFREIIHAGAFDDVLDDDVRALWNHDTSSAANLLGRTTAGTLSLSVDKKGLHYSIDPPTDAEPLLERIKRGDVSQSSFAFSIARDGDEWEEDDEGRVVRHIVKVERLFDVSPVVFPAYPQTDVSARAKQALDELRNRKIEQERQALRMYRVRYSARIRGISQR